MNDMIRHRGFDDALDIAKELHVMTKTIRRGAPTDMSRVALQPESQQERYALKTMERLSRTNRTGLSRYGFGVNAAMDRLWMTHLQALAARRDRLQYVLSNNPEWEHPVSAVEQPEKRVTSPVTTSVNDKLVGYLKGNRVAIVSPLVEMTDDERYEKTILEAIGRDDVGDKYWWSYTNVMEKEEQEKKAKEQEAAKEQERKEVVDVFPTMLHEEVIDVDDNGNLRTPCLNGFVDDDDQLEQLLANENANLGADLINVV